MENSISKVIENVMDGRINTISGCIMDGSANIMNLMLGISLCFMILNKYLITVLTTLITLAISSSNYAEINEWNKMYILRNFNILNTQKIAVILKLCHLVEISIIHSLVYNSFNVKLCSTIKLYYYLNASQSS
jgi:hypothetical protein